MRFYSCFLILLQILFFVTPLSAQQTHRIFFLNYNGDDANDGSKNKPWKTIERLNQQQLKPGNIVYLQGGQIFKGTLRINEDDHGIKAKPIVITSYGNSNATIDAGNASAVIIKQSSFVFLSRIKCIGSGRKNGNTKDGIAILNSNHVRIEDIDVKGFQKAGLMLYDCDSVKVAKVYAHENGAAGIAGDGEYQKRNLQRIHITDCIAENNPGDPTNLTNHSGNGIVIGDGKNILIEYCSATNNGWDMPRTGNGPVGIWCWESDSVIIQHCISYRNKTSPGGGDGGGFDLDGGVTNSVIQYCLSYENQGSGFGIFQYDGASNWHDNTIRFCISENDGSVSPAGAGVFIWNSSVDTNQFKRCFFYNNIVYNEKGAAISYEAQSANTQFAFLNNIFIGKDSLIIGRETNSVYLGNNWYSLQSGFNSEGIKNFTEWARQKKKEQINQKLVGLNLLPQYTRPGLADLTEPRRLKTFFNYQVKQGNKGVDLKKIFNIDLGNKDFNGLPVKVAAVGACVN